MRTGPDLLNIGARQPSRDWHLGHLYAPRAYTPGSIMPGYPYLFEVRQGEARPGEVVVNVPPAFSKPGQVVVAKPEALALVEYLLSLDRTYPALKPLPVMKEPS
jgi:cytochrome c oxidase cbb3-type subunit 2